MSMPKTSILIIAAIVLVVLSSLSTYAFLTLQSSGTSQGFGDQSSRRFDVFESYNQCEKAVRNSVSGKVISVEGDDRAAQYHRSTNLNMLFFAVDYSESRGMLGYSGGQVKRLYARCEVSAETNRIEAVKLRPADEKEYTEIIRRPE
ncbi:MAG: hypothetical protein ACRBBW_15720 [Cellvibrionaceae bacterium]